MEHIKYLTIFFIIPQTESISQVVHPEPSDTTTTGRRPTNCLRATGWLAGWLRNTLKGAHNL